MTYQTPLAVTVRLYDRLLGSLPRCELAAHFCCLFLQPREEWARISAAKNGVKGTLLPYAIILALIGPIAQFVGRVAMMVFGPLNLSLIALLQGLLMLGLGAVLNLFVVYGLVQIIHGVALKYGKTVKNLDAFKLAIYGLTAFFFSQGLSHLPMMGGAAILVGGYSLYQLYLGTALVIEADPADQPRVNLMVPGLALAFYMAIIGAAGLIVWLAR